jgi:hypothetical protein
MHYIYTLLPFLPHDIHHYILLYLGYKNRNGKYIKQLPEKMKIYSLLNRMNDVTVYNPDLPLDANMMDYYYLSFHHDSEYIFCISLDIYQKKNTDLFSTVKTMEIYYSQYDRNKFKYKVRYYYIRPNDSTTRSEYSPIHQW